MAIRFIEIHPADDDLALNSEWVIITNDGKLAFHTRGATIEVGKRGSAKRYPLGVFDPGFLLKPGDKIRMLTGSPGEEVHGVPPDETDDVKNYFLTRRHAYVREPGTVLTLMVKDFPVTKAEFDPASPSGVRT